MAGIISLTTDFGITDEYVGVMKGVILGIAPHCQVVDVTHSIQAQNIRQAAFIIATAYPFYPAGTLHVVVVDPGVGSARNIVLLCAENHMFLTPDNGVLTIVLQKESKTKVYEVTNDSLFLPKVSNTFHGRDIFAPVAAKLITDLGPEQVGQTLDVEQLIKLDNVDAIVNLNPPQVVGQVVHIDHFGNIMTNITGKNVEEIMNLDKNASINISLNNRVVSGLYQTYSKAKMVAPFALVGSRNLLEISIKNGNAATYLNARIADKVILSLQHKSLLFT